METVDLERAYFIDRSGRAHVAEGSRRFLAKAKVGDRVRILAPDEAEAAGVPFGTPWTDDLATVAQDATEKAAAAGADEEDLAPLADPVEADPEPVEDAPPALDEPSDAPEVPADDPPAPPASSAPPRGPVEERPPPVDAPPSSDPAEGAPSPVLAMDETHVLAMLLGDVATDAWGSLLVRIGTPKGHAPMPLTDAERDRLRTAVIAVLVRYFPDFHTNHPELWAFGAVSLLTVVSHRQAAKRNAAVDLPPAPGPAAAPSAPAPEVDPPAPAPATVPDGFLRVLG